MKKLTATIITVLLLTVGQATFASNPIITQQAEFENLIELVDSDTFHFKIDDSPTQLDIEGPIIVQEQSVLKNFLIDVSYLITINGIATGSFEVNNLTLSQGSGTLEIKGGDVITLTSNSIIQDDGIIRVTGGTGMVSYGIKTESLTQNAGIITATGGESGGIYATSITQNGGTITATGGESGAIYATSITQNGGTINANGSSTSTSTKGIFVTSITQNGGTINATGGDRYSTFGIDVVTIVQNGGSIDATGGEGVNSSVNFNFGITASSIIQNGGSIKASGGVNEAGIYGRRFNISSSTSITQNGGYIEAIGSSKNNIPGIRNFDIITQNAGIIDARGGDGTNSHGISFSSKFSITQNGGRISVTGGIGNDSNGIFSAAIASITQNDGVIISKGNDGMRSHGINLGSDSNIILNGGYIEAIGGSVASSHGINGGSIIQNDGVIFAEGFSGYGINAGTITQHNGKILANGAIDANSYGISAETITQNDGTITANAGKGANAYGINAETIAQSGGIITATAGNVKDAHGINVNILIQDGGMIIANGSPEIIGSGNYAYAIYATEFTQNNGTIIATASNDFAKIASYFNNITQNGGTIIGIGNGNGSYGIYVESSVGSNDDGVIIQNGGTIRGIGGITGGSGIGANIITQNAGIIEAIGGTGGSAYNAIGIRANNFDVSGVLYISREAAISSIVVINNLNFKSGATLIPVVDLSKNPTIASGLITVRNIFIVNTNATLKPQFINTYMLKENDTLENVPFISSDNNINTGNKFKEEGNTITLSYVTSIMNKEYYLSITREMTPREAFEKGNAKTKLTNLVGDIYDFITETDDVKNHSLLIDMLDKIDGSATVEEAVNSIYRTINSSVYNELINWNSVTRREFNNNFIGLNAKLEDVMTSENKIWADASISFGKNTIGSENFTNATLGYANKFGKLSVGAQLSASTGNITGNSVLSSRLSFGAIVMAKYIYGINKFLNPGASVVVGFNYSSLENTTKQNSIDVGLHLSNKFNITDKITIEPIIGANYILNSFNEFSYDYDNASQSIPKTTYNYLILNANLNVSYKVTESISANFRGFFNYDILKNVFAEDLAIGSEYAITNALDANTMSYGAGVDAQYVLPSGGASINLGYLLYISENYTNHQFKLGINTTF